MPNRIQKESGVNKTYRIEVVKNRANAVFAGHARELLDMVPLMFLLLPRFLIVRSYSFISSLISVIYVGISKMVNGIFGFKESKFVGEPGRIAILKRDFGAFAEAIVAVVVVPVVMPLCLIRAVFSFIVLAIISICAGMYKAALGVFSYAKNLSQGLYKSKEDVLAVDSKTNNSSISEGQLVEHDNGKQDFISSLATLEKNTSGNLYQSEGLEGSPGTQEQLQQKASDEDEAINSDWCLEPFV